MKQSKEDFELKKEYDFSKGIRGRFYKPKKALLLAVREGATAIATDDRNAIRASKFLKLEFITATTVLIRAFEKGLIDRNAAIIKLQKLQSVGRYSKAIIDDAMMMVS